MGIRIFIFLSGKLLYFFLGQCDYSDKFPKVFYSSCGGECPSTANFCHQCGQQLNFSQVSYKAASSVDMENLLLKEYFHRGYPYAAIVSLLKKRHGVRMHVRVLIGKLKNRPRKLRPCLHGGRVTLLRGLPSLHVNRAQDLFIAVFSQLLR